MENALRKAGGAVSNGQRPLAIASNSQRIIVRPKLDSEPISKSSATEISPSQGEELRGLNSTTICSVTGQSTTSRVRWDQRFFPNRDDSATPRMEIRRDITISTSRRDRIRNNSLESFDSKERFLAKPELVHMGKDVTKRSYHPGSGAIDRIESIPSD